jgi:hypothetical protein
MERLLRPPTDPELPFGGVGNSGMAKYHGRWGFEAFTNARGVLYHSPLIDPGVKYPDPLENMLKWSSGGSGASWTVSVGAPTGSTTAPKRSCCSTAPMLGAGVRSH